MKKQTTRAAVTITTVLLAGQAFAFGGGIGGGMGGGSFGGHQGGSALSQGSRGGLAGLAGQHQGSNGQSNPGSVTKSGGNGKPAMTPTPMGTTSRPASMPPATMPNPQMNATNTMQGQMGTAEHVNGPMSRLSRMDGTGSTTKQATPSTN